MSMDLRSLILTKVMEECSEVTQAAAKLQQFGPDFAHPANGVSNLEHLIGEINDLHGVVELLRRDFALDGLAMPALYGPVTAQRKINKVLHWAKLCIEQGRLDPAAEERMRLLHSP